MQRIIYFSLVCCLIYTKVFSVSLIGSGVTTTIGGTVFVEDSFSGEGSNVALTAHTGETGATWTAISGLNSLNVSNTTNSVYSPTENETQGNYASGTPTSNEYDIEANITVVGASGVGVLGRCATDSETFYYARNLNGTLELFKAVSGSYTSLGTYNIGNTNAGTIKLEIRNAAKKVYWEGVERISSNNNDITSAGRAGIRGRGQASTPYVSRLDNFKATNS